MTAPAVAWVGVGSNVGKVTTGDIDTNWTGSLAVDTVNFVEGTASLGEKVSAATIEVYTVDATDVTGEPFDFSSGGGNEGDHVFGFLNIFAAWDTIANGGFGLSLAEGNATTDATGTWYVGPQAGYLGGWASYVIDPTNDFDNVVAGTPVWTLAGNPAQLNAVDGFGCRWKTTVTITGNTNNAFVDSISVGEGYRATLGDAGSAEVVFQDYIDFEDTVSTGRFGGLRAISGLLLAKCKLYVGALSGATNTEMIDSGFTVVWEQQVLSDGVTSAVAAGFYEFGASQGTGTTDITLSDGTLAAKSPHDVVVSLSGINGVTITTVALDRGRTVALDDACSWNDSSITNTGLITLGGATFSGNTLSGSTVAADASAMIWDFNADPNGELDDITITKGAAAHHAIEFGTTAPLTMTLTGWTTSGFNAADANNDSTFLFADRGSDVTWTLNVVGGVGNFSFKKVRSGDTVNIVIDPVATLVHVDDNEGVDLQSARVYLTASDGLGPLPYQDSVTITRATTVATVAHTAHGMETGDKVVIKGITDKTEDNNGTHAITWIDANSYSYVTDNSGSTSYTGTIVSTWVSLDEDTDVNGDATVSKTFTGDQNVTGRVRKSTASPRFKTFDIAGTISSSAGLTINVQLILDE